VDKKYRARLSVFAAHDNVLSGGPGGYAGVLNEQLDNPIFI
jgi:hypothetical protein